MQHSKNNWQQGCNGRVVEGQNLFHTVVNVVLVGPDWVDLDLVHRRLDARICEDVLHRPQSQCLSALS